MELVPQVDVLHRLSIGGAPAVALPLVDPRRDADAQIFAVGVEVNQTRSFERFERCDRRRQFHAVIGAVEFAAFPFLLWLAESADRTPATGPPIRRAASVGVNDDVLLIADVRLAHSSIP